MKKRKSKLLKLSFEVFGVLIGSISTLASSCSLTSNLTDSNNDSGESSDSNKVSTNSTLSDQNIELNIETINNLKNWNLYPSNIKDYQANLQNLIYSKNANFIDLNTGLIYDLTSTENINSLTSQYKKANPNASQEEINNQIEIYQTTTNLLYLQVAPEIITYWYAVLHVIDVNNYSKWNLDQWWIQNTNLWTSNNYLNSKYLFYIQNYYDKQNPIPISTKTQMVNDFETIYGQDSVFGYYDIKDLNKFTNLRLDNSLSISQKLNNQNYQNYNYYNLLAKLNELVNSKIFDDRSYTKFLNLNDKNNLIAIKKYVPNLIDEINQFQLAYKKYFEFN